MGLPVTQRHAKEYKTRDGKTPFRDWLVGLRDSRAQAKITKAITQMEAGNCGDHKLITGGKGLYERRINYGPGYRIYYIAEGSELIILFSGSDKSNQRKVIAQVKEYFKDYRERQKLQDGSQ